MVFSDEFVFVILENVILTTNTISWLSLVIWFHHFIVYIEFEMLLQNTLKLRNSLYNNRFDYCIRVSWCWSILSVLQTVGINLIRNAKQTSISVLQLFSNLTINCVLTILDYRPIIQLLLFLYRFQVSVYAIIPPHLISASSLSSRPILLKITQKNLFNQNVVMFSSKMLFAKVLFLLSLWTWLSSQSSVHDFMIHQSHFAITFHAF